MIDALTNTLLWSLTVFNALAIFALVQKLTELRRVLDENGASFGRLPLGSPLPKFEAVVLASEQAINSADIARENRALLFLSTGCRDCANIISGLSQANAAALVGLAIYCDGARRACGLFFPRRLADTRLVFFKGNEDIAAALRLSAFPVMILLDQQSRIAAYRYPSSADDVLGYLAGVDSAAQPLVSNA